MPDLSNLLEGLDAPQRRAAGSVLHAYAQQLRPMFDAAVEEQAKRITDGRRPGNILKALGLTALAVPAVYGGYRFFKDRQGQPEEPQIEPVKAAHLVKRAEPVGSLPPRPLSPDEIRYGVSR